MDRGAWRATIHGVPKSQAQLSDLACMHNITIVVNITFRQGVHILFEMVCPHRCSPGAIYPFGLPFPWE